MGAITLSAEELLEAHYGLTPEVLGLTSEAFTQRVALWEQLVSERPEEKRAAGVRVLALRAWVTRLLAQADKFRAEGDVAIERDMLGRVKVVQGWLSVAQVEAAAGGEADVSDSGNPTPVLEAWGIR